MERDAAMSNKPEMKVDIPGEVEAALPALAGGLGVGGGLARQGSITKNNCLCSPTTHVGSFRCRLHRAPSLQGTKSIDSTTIQDSQSKPSNHNQNPQLMSHGGLSEGSVN